MKIGEYDLNFLIQRTKQRIDELKENEPFCKKEVRHLVKLSIKSNEDLLNILLSMYGYQ